jgi:hypothetical protein
MKVLTLLADHGQWRAFSAPGLIIAAAELAELTVLHGDKVFDLIASVTGGPPNGLLPRRAAAGHREFSAEAGG